MTHLLPVLLWLNRQLRRIVGWTHKLQFETQWKVSKPADWYDHFIDQHWKWNATRNPLSWERGIYDLLVMEPGCRLLDLCCGGGFYTRHFFSSRANRIVAVDYDPVALGHARRNCSAPNIEYICADIRTAMPEGEFDNIVWDAGIEYFTAPEISEVLANIRRRLGDKGILSGYTLVGRPKGSTQTDHEYKFSTKEELAGNLKKFFANVFVLETTSSDQFEQRQNFYFFASNGPVPFDPTWGRHVRL